MVDLENLKEYKAKVIYFMVTSSEIKHRTFWPEGAPFPHLGPFTNSFKRLEAHLEFRGTRHEIEINKSKFKRDLLKEGTIVDGPFSYIGAYQVVEVVDQFYGFETVVLEGQVAHLGPQEVIILNGSRSFNNTGTAPTGPCKLELVGSGTLTINGEDYGPVSNMTLDSFTGEILPPGSVEGTTFTKLPYIKDGDNLIELTGGLTGTLTYRPLYI